MHTSDHAEGAEPDGILDVPLADIGLTVTLHYQPVLGSIFRARIWTGSLVLTQS